jgi:Na+-driven multidrug efflux pump
MSATEEPSILEPAVLEEEQPAYSFVRDPRTFQPLMRLALPVFFGQVLDMFVGLTDTWLAGRYLPGDDYLAAMNVVNYSLWFLISIFSLIAIGTTALVLASRWGKPNSTRPPLDELILDVGNAAVPGSW